MEIDNREEYQLEIANRIRNLVWTVCQDYTMEVKPDVETFLKYPAVAVYDGIRQGAFARYFDKEMMSMYLIKKVYLQAAEEPLLTLAWMVIEEAVHGRLLRERPGAVFLRKEAFETILDRQFKHLSGNALGRLKLAVLREALNGEFAVEARMRGWMNQLYELRNADETITLIQTVDRLYNEVFDPQFESRVGGLDRVLAVTMEELTENSWRDFLTEEMYEENLEQYLEQVAEKMMTSDIQNQPEEEESGSHEPRITIVTEEALEKAYTYVERNFGKTYLSPLEEKRRNHLLCKGIHGDCSLYYTEGILQNPVLRNYQYEYAKKQKAKNKYAYYENHRIVKQNIAILSDLLKKALARRGEGDYMLSDHGEMIPSRLWRIGHTQDVRVFRRDSHRSEEKMVVELLIDASGSQRIRQEQVALQAYIISEALSSVSIPHRIMSFCTFWDYTVLQRFRDYDDPRSENERIFEFTTSSNNRDGLAFLAAAQGLLEREEEKKLLIVLSDGRPYDVLINRPNARNPKPYTGREAVRDTAFSVRKLRNEGIVVLGVFAGEEKDLEAEKRIFGKDFAYIREIGRFSKVTGKYLLRLLNDIG